MTETTRQQGSVRASAQACALAIALVIAADLLVFGVHGPWEELRARIPGGGCGVENGIVRDRLAMRALEAAPSGQPRAFVLGSSRACEGFRENAVGKAEREGIGFTKLAHAAVTPVAIRSIVSVVEASDARAVAVLLSEFDTHSPVILVPEASFGGFGVIAELSRLMGASFVREERTSLFRYGAAALLRSYRYRRVLDVAGFDQFRSFEFGSDSAKDEQRLKPRKRAEPRARLGAPPRGDLPPERFRAIRDDIVARFPRSIPRAEFNQLRVLGRGEHVAVQMGLLEASFRSWRESGIEVVIVEGPLNPLAAALYDPSLRGEFVEFALRMERELGVRFVPLDAADPYTVDDFKDLTHVGRSGWIRLSRSIASALREAIGIAAPTARNSLAPKLREPGPLADFLGARSR